MPAKSPTPRSILKAQKTAGGHPANKSKFTPPQTKLKKEPLKEPIQKHTHRRVAPQNEESDSSEDDIHNEKGGERDSLDNIKEVCEW